MIVNIGGMGLGQLMIGLGETGGVGLFLMASVMVSIAVVPILITVSPAPNFGPQTGLDFDGSCRYRHYRLLAWPQCGLIISMLFGMGPVYGRNLGLNNTEIGYFMTSIMVGTLLLQYPVGRLSDKFDRRAVILGAASTVRFAFPSPVYLTLASLFPC